LKRRKDRENEGFLFAKKDGRRNWMVRPKKWDRWEGVWFKSTAAFHRMDFFRCKFLSCLKLSLPSTRVQCGRVQAVPQKSIPQHAPPNELVNTNMQRM